MNQLKKSNFDKFPSIKIDGQVCLQGWKNITDKLRDAYNEKHTEKVIVAIECYHGVYTNELFDELRQHIPEAILFNASTAMKAANEIEKMVYPFVTDDPVFGYMAPLSLADFFSSENIASLQQKINVVEKGICIVYGIGASLIEPAPGIFIYADMPRWEIQLRFRNKSVSNIGAQNPFE
jgi:hypothetical protein